MRSGRSGQRACDLSARSRNAKIWRNIGMSVNVLMRPCAITMVTLALLTSACAKRVPSGTDAVCDALRPVLPTYSVRDTAQTKEEGDRFLTVFGKVCEG